MNRRVLAANRFGIGKGRASGWAAWKDAFLMPDGRVVDHLQQGASHSEGQGYGLVLSVFHGDRQAFDLIRTWTFAQLGNRADGLLNWRKIPNADAAEPMNATDGDIFCAWGLATGAFGSICPAHARRHAGWQPPLPSTACTKTRATIDA